MAKNIPPELQAYTARTTTGKYCRASAICCEALPLYKEAVPGEKGFLLPSISPERVRESRDFLFFC